MRGKAIVSKVVRTLALVALLGGIPSGATWAGPQKEPKKAAAAAVERPLDINKASEEDLAQLPGIGEAIARRIVEFRAEHGPFRRVDDLLKVKGIGERSLEKLRASVTVGSGR